MEDILIIRRYEMSAFFVKLGMGILGELAIRVMKPEMIVDLLVAIAKKAAAKTETGIDDMIVKALEK